MRDGFVRGCLQVRESGGAGVMALREGGDRVREGEEGCSLGRGGKGARVQGGCRRARGRAEWLDTRGFVSWAGETKHPRELRTVGDRGLKRKSRSRLGKVK